MDMRKLRIFCAVADEGSFTGAAQIIHTVQSNITQRIKELEDELGQVLFVRQKSGAILTPAGEVFLGYARKILQLCDESRIALDEKSSHRVLRIGAMETTAAIRLPSVLGPYRKVWPKVQLSLITGTTTELLKAVENHKLDGAFVGGSHQNAAIRQEIVFEEELVLLSSTDFNSLKKLTQQMSRITVLAFRAGCFYRSRLESWLHRQGLTPEQTLELGTLDGIMSCVSAGMGITLLPRSFAEHYATRHPIKFHSLPAEFCKVETVFAQRKDMAINLALEAFLEITRQKIGIDNANAS